MSNLTKATKLNILSIFLLIAGSSISSMIFWSSFGFTLKGAEAGAIIYSLLATCKANLIEPYAYLKYVLDQLPRCKIYGLPVFASKVQYQRKSRLALIYPGFNEGNCLGPP